MTLPLLGFEYTCFEIKSRDMNENRKDFIFCNKPYMPSEGLHGPLHLVMVCAPSLSLLLPQRLMCMHTYTVELPAAAWAEGWRSACT